MPQRVVVI